MAVVDVAVAAMTDGVVEEEVVIRAAKDTEAAAPSPDIRLSLSPPPPPGRLDADDESGRVRTVVGEARDKGDAPAGEMIVAAVDESVVAAAPAGAVIAAVEELVVVAAAAAAAAAAALSTIFPPRPLPPGSVTGCSSAPALQMGQVNLLW